MKECNHIADLENSIRQADNELIKALGNGSKLPMVAYWYGVVSKLTLNVLRKRKVADIAPGYTYLKKIQSDFKNHPLFISTRKEEGFS